MVCVPQLFMLAFFRTVGKLLMITTSIIKQDVVPFLAFALVVIMGFDLASNYLAWTIHAEYFPGEMLYQFTGLTDEYITELKHPMSSMR